MRDTPNTDCGIHGGKRRGRRLVVGKEVKRKRKGNKRMNDKEKGMVRNKGQEKRK